MLQCADNRQHQENKKENFPEPGQKAAAKGFEQKYRL
jgi:hypothetical protein